MRFIDKGDEPQILRQFKKIQRAAQLPATYDTFGSKGNKAALNDILRIEQRNICCYCQRRIKHFQGDKQTGAHNEHLVPQSEDPGDGSIDLDYNNIFACCIVSQGCKPDAQHCGESKGNTAIFGSIAHRDCEANFKYNLVGEILPNGKYNLWKPYLDNYDTLSRSEKLLVDEITTLNLNCNSLIYDRKVSIDVMCEWAEKASTDAINAKLQDFSERAEFPEFYSTIKFILTQIVNNRTKP